MAPLSAGQIWNCVVVERCSASLSVVSTLTMFTAFVCFPRLRTLSNTLLFFASFANLGANTAALIGGSALSRTNSALCQIQGFLLEWFMQSDPMWGTCMALNVYFVIFRRWEPAKLKTLFKWYILACYGIPFIPAIFCLFFKNQKKGRVYGNATLWCWIDNDWQVVRIYSYYGPIWCYILVTFLIYFRVGFEVFRKRSALRALGTGNHTHNTLVSQSAGTMNKRNSWVGVQNNSRNSWSSNQSAKQKPFTGTRTTEVEVTSTQSTLMSPAPSHIRPGRVQEPGNFVDISTSNEKNRRHSYSDIPRGWYSAFKGRLNRIDHIKLAYTRCAMLFAVSILITWVPSSANRVYSLAHKSPSYGLNLASSAVLPLQGFWNTIIFFWTSWNIVKEEYRQFRMGRAVTARQRERANTGSVIHMHDRKEQPVYVGSMGGGPGYDGTETESTRQVLDDDDDEMEASSHRGFSSHGYTRSNSYSRNSAGERPTSST